MIRAQESSTVERQAGGAESVATQIRATLDQAVGAGSYHARSHGGGGPARR